MRKTATRTITTTGVLTVLVSPDTATFYVNYNFWASISWSPVSGSSCTLVINWGDGTIETKTASSSPSGYYHIYTTAGQRTITATVTDNGTGATGSDTGTVNVLSELTAGLTSDKTSGIVPLTVTFTVSYGGGLSPYTVTLDYGDGSAVETITAPGTKSHIYTKVGTFTATLVVVDSLGYTGVITSSIFTDVLNNWNALTSVQKALCVVSVIGGIGLVAWKLKNR